MKCLLGYYRADEGSFLVDGREETIARPADADALGLGMVYQHFTLVPSMTVAENLVMSRRNVPAVIDWRQELAELDAIHGAHAVQGAAGTPRSAVSPPASGRRPKSSSSFICNAASWCWTSRPRC